MPLPNGPNVLFVDDDAPSARGWIRSLRGRKAQFTPHHAETVEHALELAKTIRPQAAVVDLTIDPHVGPKSGLELIGELLRLDPALRVIVLTGHDAEQCGVDALLSGASSYLQKPPNIESLLALIDDAINVYGLRCKYLKLASDAKSVENILGLESRSPAMKPVIEAALLASSNKQPVLITGDTGTGKGVFAHAIHRLALGNDSPFVRFQPTYMGTDIIASELFGHKKGAFTGATQERKGLIAEADGGTLFIDEVAELPKETQIVLLDVLQEHKFRPVGSNTEVKSAFRLITATNCPLEDLKERLRPDFYHRIAHTRIALPSLQERREDIPLLAEAFLHEICNREKQTVYRISKSAIAYLSRQQWDGNIRELQARVESAINRAAFHQRCTVEPSDFAEEYTAAPTEQLSFREQVQSYEIELVQDAMKRCNNQTQAAKFLKMDRSTLQRVLRRAD